MKKILFSLIFSLVIVNFYSQTVDYKYDANGNRFQRLQVCNGCNIVIKPNTPDTTKKKSEAECAKIAMENGISVYPNPTKGLVNVSIIKGNRDEEQKDEATFYIMDNNGRILSKKTQAGIETSFDMSSYKAGVYYLRVFYNSKNLYYKIIKAD